MAEAVYLLGTITSLTCAILLLRSFGERRTGVLFWSGLCFLGLAANNILLLLDLYVVASVSLAIARSVVAFASLLLLLLALVWNLR